MKLVAWLLSWAILLGASLSAANITEAKKLLYAEQTPENVERFKTVLETLVSENNVQAMIMLGEAYQTGSHWQADEAKALGYYERAAKLGNATAAERAALLLEKRNEPAKAKAYYETALEAGRHSAVKPLLVIAIKAEDADAVKTYVALSKQYGIPLDPDIAADVTAIEEKNANFGIGTIMGTVEDTTFEATATYIKAVMKTLVSMEGAFKNLGYDMEEYLINEGVEPLIELHLARDASRKVDMEMAYYIAGDNTLKKAILRSIIWANKMSVFLEDEMGYTVVGMEIEISSSVISKLVIKKQE